MSVTGNYRGILVDSGQYRLISNIIEFKHVVHFNPPKEADPLATFLDRIWFRLGHRSIPTFIVASKSHHILSELCRAGLLYDMRGYKIPDSQGAMYDLMHEVLSGKATFINKCNEIRNILASRPKIRWCGAELESVFNQHIHHNATEICGNATIGYYCSPSGRLTGVLPNAMNERHMREFFMDMLEFSEDDGQRKLGLIMYAIPRVGYNIIYVGGSPGHAWLHTLRQRNFEGTIVSIDPLPLSQVPNINCHIIQIQAMVNGVEDIPKLLEKEGLSNLKDIVFIWDVRHANARDMTEEARTACIASEISLLNGICNSLWFRNHVKIYQLKMNSSNLDLYEMPMDACIYAQPFTLSRDVYELRITGHIENPDYSLTTLSAEMQVRVREYSHVLKTQLDNGRIDEYRLFINFMCSMYRRCDYIETPPLVEPEWEIALFTLNWNSSAKLSRYFDRIYNSNIKFIGSFFTKHRLTEDEYPFPEYLLLLRYPSMVFDSRALTNTKLEGLYFFANTVDCRHMENEILFSESYLIGSTEYKLHSLGMMHQYDEVRTAECARINAIFPKFPNSFSASDNIISPSGHALRMFIEYAQDSASLCMFAHKILSNFYRAGASEGAS